MEKILMIMFFILIVSIVGYLLWLVRSPEGRPEYYENSKSEKIKEVIDEYEPR